MLRVLASANLPLSKSILAGEANAPRGRYSRIHSVTARVQPSNYTLSRSIDIESSLTW